MSKVIDGKETVIPTGKDRPKRTKEERDNEAASGSRLGLDKNFIKYIFSIYYHHQNIFF